MVLLRGHDANPWDLGVWSRLTDRHDVSALVTRSNRYDVAPLEIERKAVTSLRDLLPKGALGSLATGVLGDRYFRLDRALEVLRSCTVPSSAPGLRPGRRASSHGWATDSF